MAVDVYICALIASTDTLYFLGMKKKEDNRTWLCIPNKSKWNTCNIKEKERGQQKESHTDLEDQTNGSKGCLLSTDEIHLLEEILDRRSTPTIDSRGSCYKFCQSQPAKFNASFRRHYRDFLAIFPLRNLRCQMD